MKVGIELSKTAAVHWSDEDMKKALESVRSGGMSINQVCMDRVDKNHILISSAYWQECHRI